MIVYECDRCHKQQQEQLFVLHEDGDLSYTVMNLPSHQRPLVKQELCTDCTRELGEWQRRVKGVK